MFRLKRLSTKKANEREEAERTLRAPFRWEPTGTIDANSLLSGRELAEGLGIEPDEPLD